MAKRRFKKIFIITAIVIISLVLVVILVVSPIAKYMIEKYDEKYTGRQIDIGWLYINPFTGYIHMQNVKLFEYKSNNIFFSANGISVNIALLKLISKNYEISGFTLNGPRVRIIQNGKEFNFSDMLRKFATDEKVPVKKEPVHFGFKNIKIKNGEFYYVDKLVPVNYFIKNVNFSTKGKEWDVDTLNGKFSFLSGPGTGSIKGDFFFNVKNNDFRVATVVDKFDLKIVEQYMNQLANYGKLRATMDANLLLAGNIKDSMSMVTKGRLAINDFHFGKSEEEDYFSFDKLVLKFIELNLKKGVRMFDTVMIVRPVMKYERYDILDNIQLMFGENGSMIDSAQAHPEKFNLVLKIADYMKMLAKTFARDYFKINRFAIEKADLKFNDYSLSEKFSMSLSPFTVTADSIDKNRDRIIIKLKTLLQPHGEASAQLNINPKNYGFFEMSYKLQNVPASLFNPYLITFTSFPLDRGKIEFHGNWLVKDSVINSENHFIIIDPRVSKRVRKKDTKWIPMPLIMAFVRERGNVIDYKIPIEGSLKDPKFKIADVFYDLLKNIFVKPPSSPYIFEVKNIENEVEKSLNIKWIMRTAVLLPNQGKFIEKMSEFLKDNSEASISISPIQYATKEKEHILLYEAKKKYYMAKNNKDRKSIDEDDSLKIEKMSVKDSTFVKYLNAYVKDPSLYTIQQKCQAYLGENIVQQKYGQLLKQREVAFMKYFKENHTDKQVKILKTDNEVPFNGFSYYKISYKGDIPDELLEAYEKLNDLDEENPRKQYKRWRS